jgi:DnaJ like chaperone protein
MLPWITAFIAWLLTRSVWMVLLGYGIGVWLSRRFVFDWQRPDSLFFNTTFAVMGHLAKTTGRVTEDDIAMASQWMHYFRLSPVRRQEAQRAFYQGMQPDYGWHTSVLALRQRYRHQPSLLSFFLDIQIRTALNDDVLQPAEHLLLQKMAHLLGISSSQLDVLIEQCQSQTHNQSSNVTSEQAYQILGLKPGCSMSELKRSYRHLMKQYHPDKMIAQGMPKEMIDVAKEKVQTIQHAYDHLKHQHKGVS